MDLRWGVNRTIKPQNNQTFKPFSIQISAEATGLEACRGWEPGPCGSWKACGPTGVSTFLSGVSLSPTVLFPLLRASQ